MFGGTLTTQSVERAFGNLKHHVGQPYHITKHFLGQVDHGAQVANTIYGAVAPVLEHYGGGAANKHIIRAIGGYEHLRNKVMDTLCISEWLERTLFRHCIFQFREGNLAHARAASAAQSRKSAKHAQCRISAMPKTARSR